MTGRENIKVLLIGGDRPPQSHSISGPHSPELPNPTSTLFAFSLVVDKSVFKISPFFLSRLGGASQNEDEKESQ